MTVFMLKFCFAVLAIPFATWTSIRSYWGELYRSGAVELPNVGAMVILRGVVLLPFQLLILGLMAFLLRRRLGRVRWGVLIMAAALAWPVARWVDAVGMRYSGARWLWDVGPPAVGVVLLGLALCVVRSAPNSTQQPMSAPEGARS